MPPATSGSGRPTQTYRERPPAPALAPYLACTWIHRIGADGPAYEHRRVPDGCVDIRWTAGQSLIEVVGPQRGPVTFLLPPRTTVAGIRLRPGAAPAALGVPASALVDRRVPLDAVWDDAPAASAGRIAQAGSPREAVTLLEEAVATRTAGRRGLDPVGAAVLDLLRRHPSLPAGKLTAELYVSSRQLRRHCVAAFGYGPKSLQRLLRFQTFLVLGTRRGGTIEGLAEIARVAGYADQPHLTRECVALTGVTPRRFLAETAKSCGRNHDHAAPPALVGDAGAGGAAGADDVRAGRAQRVLDGGVARVVVGGRVSRPWRPATRAGRSAG
ncbi:MAG TPA: helix-turn-helix domain-containing protein [Streptosporangiaceae bacterium]